MRITFCLALFLTVILLGLSQGMGANYVCLVSLLLNGEICLPSHHDKTEFGMELVAVDYDCV